MPRTTCEALAAPWTLNCSIGQPTGANAPRLGAGRRWRDGRWSRRGMGTDQLDDPYRNDDSGCHSESEVAASEDSFTEREVAPQNGDQRVGGSYAGLGSDQAASVQRALQQKDPEHPRHHHGVRRPGEEDLRRTTRKGTGHRLHERRPQPEGSSGGDPEQGRPVERDHPNEQRSPARRNLRCLLPVGHPLQCRRQSVRARRQRGEQVRQHVPGSLAAGSKASASAAVNDDGRTTSSDREPTVNGARWAVAIPRTNDLQRAGGGGGDL